MLRTDCIEQHIQDIARIKGLTQKYQKLLFTLFDDPFNITGTLQTDINFLIKIGLVNQVDDGDYQINRNWIPHNFHTADFDNVKGIAIAHSIATGAYESKFTYYRRLPNE